MGKTQLALHFCNTRRTQYNAILWIDCTNAQTAIASLHKIAKEIINEANKLFPTEEQAVVARRLGMTDALTELSTDSSTVISKISIVKATLRWLAMEENDNWLLVLDNRDDDQNFNIRYLFPPCEHGHIVITSRVGVHNELGLSIALEGLEEVDGIRLLIQDASAEGMNVFFSHCPS
jgi:hypothetical protein